MAVDLDVLLEATAAVLADLDKRSAQVSELRAKARQILEQCERDDSDIERERAAIGLTEKIFRARFVPDDEKTIPLPPRDSQPDLEIPGAKKPKARIGHKRYRIFAMLRHKDNLATDAEIANTTGLSLRFVRNQLRLDCAEGLFRPAEGDKSNNWITFYKITPDGADLFDRFVQYKRNHAEPLPALTGPISDGDELSDDDDSGDADVAA